jgi:hypothetical protein
VSFLRAPFVDFNKALQVNYALILGKESDVKNWIVTVVVGLALSAWGCSGPGDKGNKDVGSDLEVTGVGDGIEVDTGSSDTDSTSGCDKGEGQVCCAGEANGCTPDGKALLACNEDGSGWDQVDCTDEEGDPTVCFTSAEQPDGYCGVCYPDTKKCANDETLLKCNQFGTEWVEDIKCDDASDGLICVQTGGSGACVKLCDVNEKLNMYMGCDFWAADLDNAFVSGGRSGYFDAAGSQYSVVVSNPNIKYPANVQIYNNEGEVLYDASDELFPTEPILPGELRIYNLPRRDLDGTVLAPLAYRVQANIPITAYQFNPLENVEVFSNDASLLLPSNVLGKYYYVMTREQTFNELRSFLTVVAVRNGTTKVTIDVTAPTLVGENVWTGQAIDALKSGDTFTADLQQYDVLNLETDLIGSDLTGSMILASKDVAVFGGSEAANAPNTNHCLVDEGAVQGVCEWDLESSCKTNDDCTSDFNTCCADHLEQQLFPVKSWGLRYLASKTFPRNQELDVYRIIAAENNTQVTTIPPQASIPVLNQGEWIDFESKDNFEIIAKKPIMVGQFLASEQAPDPNVNGVPQPGDAGIGDPAFILLVPVEQFRKDYVFLAPNKYELDYVTIIAPDGAKVWFDCNEIKPQDIEANCDPIDFDEFELFGMGEYATHKFSISDGVHSIYSDTDVGVYVYGYDQYVSYGYPAGLNIQDLGLIKEPGE